MWYLKLIFTVLSTVVIVALFTSQGRFIQKHSHHHFARFSHFSDKETENLERRNHTAAQRQSLAPYSRLFQGHLFCLHLQQSVNGGRVQVEWRPGTPQAGAQKRQRLAMSPRAPGWRVGCSWLGLLAPFILLSWAQLGWDLLAQPGSLTQSHGLCSCPARSHPWAHLTLMPSLGCRTCQPSSQWGTEAWNFPAFL